MRLSPGVLNDIMFITINSNTTSSGRPEENNRQKDMKHRQTAQFPSYLDVQSKSKHIIT